MTNRTKMTNSLGSEKKDSTTYDSKLNMASGTRRRRVRRHHTVDSTFLFLAVLTCSNLALPCSCFAPKSLPLEQLCPTTTQWSPSNTRQILLLSGHSSLSSPPPSEEANDWALANTMVTDDLSTTTIISRRSALFLAASVAMIPLAASASTTTSSSTSKSLEDLELGDGMWKQMSDSSFGNRAHSESEPSTIVPAYFATYAARFLINYDEGIASWWNQKKNALSLLSQDQQTYKLGKSFGSLSRSIQMAMDNFIVEQGNIYNNNNNDNESSSRREAYTQLMQKMLATYGAGSAFTSRNADEVKRQIGLLFSLLPPQDQPASQYMDQFTTKQSADAPEKPVTEGFMSNFELFEPNNPPPSILSHDLSALLPANFRVARIQNTNACRIYPAISLYEVGFDEEFGQTAVGTPFGPLSSQPLTRQMPNYTPSIYALFGISGATGCALTHCVVIPLDVVKTRAQTDPDEFSDLFQAAGKIFKTEGVQGLLLGAQATLAGYSWYGLSVYPSYTFFKRWLTQTVFAPEVATVHGNDIALIAGAIAAVIASLGLTPLEAARIRVVAEPEKYRPLGLTGTLAAIAEEDKEVGWQSLYAGLPSLLTRQVIFGSIKFLAFEKASEAIFAAAPYLRDATWTSLTVSLLAGGLSGALSSVVSQPADSVLTYVAQNSRGTTSMSVIEGCRIMIQEEGPGSLFRGLGSRCVWAGKCYKHQYWRCSVCFCYHTLTQTC